MLFFPIVHALLACILLFFLISQTTVTIFKRNSSPRQCRCMPNDQCWPSIRDWDALNKSLHGNLVKVRPAGAACHRNGFNEASCAYVEDHTNNSVWRATHPATLQSTNWESGWGEDQNCPIDATRDNPCKQGRVPLYAVMAESAAEIQTAVRFARRRNLHVVVKNTGHDGSGKSSGRGAIQINTSRLKKIQPVRDFVPRGSRRSEGQAAVVGAGVYAMELSQAGANGGFTAIVGLCSTVGVAGGFIQGGGASLLGPAYGMASDNALEFEVVTAQGDLVVANQFQNQDLYWAFRGGGGGTFGVAVSTTMRTFPDTPGVVFSLGAHISRQNPDFPNANKAMWDITREVINALPAIKRTDDRTSAAFVADMEDDSADLMGNILFFNTTDVALAERKVAGLLNTLNDKGFSNVYASDLRLYPGISGFFAQPRPLDQAGEGRVEGSTFVSSDLFYSQGGTTKIMDTLSNLDFKIGDLVEIFVSGGGQVKENQHTVSSALHPNWRKTELLLTIRRILPPSSTTKLMADNQLPLLRALDTPRLGSYLNSADPEQPNWQGEFWGDNYAKLYQVKQKWDSNGLFIVNLGVGSEDWDQEGICSDRHDL
ncbi:hypothetical protein BJX99DRAFT_246788 [Aspergillus californicus]